MTGVKRIPQIRLLPEDEPPDGSAPAGFVRLRVDLPTFEGPLAITADVPDRRLRMSDVVPMAHEISDRVVAASVRHVESLGQRISCDKGCCACCEVHLPIISAPEAFRLIEDLHALPAGRRDRLEQRIAETTQAVSRKGLPEALANLTAGFADDHDRQRAISLWWSRQGIPCPLLAEGLCSIYRLRPSVCREFMTTSSPQLCAMCLSKIMPMLVKLGTVLPVWAAELESDDRDVVAPLPTVVAWCAGKLSRARRTWRGPDMVRRFFDIVLREAKAARQQGQRASQKT